jgi:hypothetical protein
MKDMRRIQAVNGDCPSSTLNLDGTGLIATVKDPIWADKRGLEGSPEGICRRNTYQAVARSLKMNVDGAASRDAGKDRSFPMLTLSREAKSVHSAREEGEEFLH